MSSLIKRFVHKVWPGCMIDIVFSFCMSGNALAFIFYFTNKSLVLRIYPYANIKVLYIDSHCAA